MQQKIKSIATNKEFYWTLLFQLTTLVGGILLMKLLAVSLSKTEYGFYALITSFVSLILMLPFTALSQGVSRYVSIYQNKSIYKIFISSSFTLFLFLIGIYIVLGILFGSFFLQDIDWEDKFFIIVILIVSEIIKSLFRTINNANRERKNIAFSVFSEFFFKISIIYIVHTMYSVSIIDVLLALIVSNIVSVIIMFMKIRKDLSFSSVRNKYFKVHVLRLWLFSYPLLIWAIFGWLRDMSNRWYLDYFLDKEQVALFAMMGSLALVVPVALQGIIGSFFIPIIYQKENSQKGFARKFLIILLPSLVILLFISFVIVYFFKDLIVVLLTDEKYLSISWMLPWMFLTYSFYVISMISTYELFAHNQTRKLIVSSVIPGIIAFIGGYFLIKKYGIEGALVNYILTYGSYALLTLYIVNHYRKETYAGA